MVHNSLPGGRHKALNLYDYSLMMGEYAQWGKLDKAKSLLQKLPIHYNSMTNDNERQFQIGKLMLFHNIYHSHNGFLQNYSVNNN